MSQCRREKKVCQNILLTNVKVDIHHIHHYFSLNQQFCSEESSFHSHVSLNVRVIVA